MNKKKIKVAAIALMVLLVGACSNKKVDESHIGVRYNDGWIEGKSYDKLVEPGGSEWVYNDSVHELPTRQITWQTGTCEGCDGPSLQITAQGGEIMNVDLAIRGFLNTGNDDKLETFFNDICNKTRTVGDKTVTGCWEDAGSEGQLGWDFMLKETFGNPLVAVANDVGLDYEAAQLRYNNETKDTFSTSFATAFKTSQKKLIGEGDYFCGPGYKRSSNECPDLSVEVTAIHYANAELEGIKDLQALAVEQEKLAAQELKTALAQQATNKAKATSQNLALLEKEAMMACANRDGCTMSFIVGGEPDVSVPVG